MRKSGVEIDQKSVFLAFELHETVEVSIDDLPECQLIHRVVADFEFRRDKVGEE